VAVRPSGTSVVEREVRIEAAPETVFSFFTDPEKMVRWMGTGATLDPRPGGVFRVDMMGEYSMAGEFVELEPYSRVVFSWGYGEPLPPGAGPNPLPSGSSTVEVVLVADGEATIVRLTHRGLPDDLHSFHELGWENYLPRLSVVAAGGDPGPDPLRVLQELDVPLESDS
jgi:uncharacterized protein YndB with AHSA1/START domain